MANSLNVSFESHLRDTLKPVLPVLDPQLQSRLAPYVDDPGSRTIPYSLLLDISKWTRSDQGLTALRASSLNPNDYTMITLLAGTTTSPERKFGTYVPPKGEDVLARERKRERKAITTIVNGVFSVAGSGAAAWIGSASTGWKYEWVSMIVASDDIEADLYSECYSHFSSRSLLQSRKLCYIFSGKVDP
jgi:TMEM199 family protein